CAVTVISSSTVPTPSAFSFAGVAAADAPEETAARMAATAYETFEFIAGPPWNFCTARPRFPTTTAAARLSYDQATGIFAGDQRRPIERTRHPAVTSPPQFF